MTNGAGFNPKQQKPEGIDSLVDKPVKIGLSNISYFGTFGGNTKDGFYVLNNPLIVMATDKGDELLVSKKPMYLPMQNVVFIQQLGEAAIAQIQTAQNHYMNEYYGRFVGISLGPNDVFGRVDKVYLDAVVLNPAVNSQLEDGGLVCGLRAGPVSIKKDQIQKTRLLTEETISYLIKEINLQNEKSTGVGSDKK